jgi:hypothetical protein
LIFKKSRFLIKIGAIVSLVNGKGRGWKESQGKRDKIATLAMV